MDHNIYYQNCLDVINSAMEACVLVGFVSAHSSIPHYVSILHEWIITPSGQCPGGVLRTERGGPLMPDCVPQARLCSPGG